MNNGFLHGMVIGALAGAAAEAVMLTCDKSMKAQVKHTMRTAGNTMEHMVDNIADTFH